MSTAQHGDSSGLKNVSKVFNKETCRTPKWLQSLVNKFSDWFWRGNLRDHHLQTRDEACLTGGSRNQAIWLNRCGDKRRTPMMTANNKKRLACLVENAEFICIW